MVSKFDIYINKINTEIKYNPKETPGALLELRTKAIVNKHKYVKQVTDATTDALNAVNNLNESFEESASRKFQTKPTEPVAKPT